MMNRNSSFPWNQALAGAATISVSLMLVGCNTVVTDDYEAIAITTYTWQAEYRPQRVTADRPRDRRIETFQANSLVTMNGQPTVEPTGDRDAQGIWWPALPPKPTVEELEARQREDEVFAEPQINQSVEYRITFDQAGERVSLPTQYPVYREAVKAYEAGRSLELTLSPQNRFVQKVEAQ